MKFPIISPPFFKAIRGEFPYNEIANLKRPCMIIDNPKVLRKVVDEHLVPEGHQHSEDIIRYAEEFKNLTDPVWLELIEDPNYRWYRHGEEYQDLFSSGSIPGSRHEGVLVGTVSGRWED